MKKILKNRNGDGLIIFAAVLLIAALCVIGLISHHDNVKKEQFKQCFGLEYPTTPEALVSNRWAVLNDTMVKLVKVQTLIAEKQPLDDKLKAMSPPAQVSADIIINYVDGYKELQVEIAKHDKDIAEAQADYNKALEIAYNAGYQKEMGVLGYKPPE